MKVTQEDLRTLWREGVVAHNEANAKSSEFNLLMNKARAERCVPPGYAIDFLGDGKIKPEGECLRLPKED